MYITLLIILATAFFLGMLNKCSDYFVNSVCQIGTRFNVSPIILGITVVAFGTSLPELVSGIIAAFDGSTAFVIGSVVGSNVANILLVLGLALLITKKTIYLDEKRIQDILWLWMATLILIVILLQTSFKSIGATVLLMIFVVYITYYINHNRKHVVEEAEITNKIMPIIATSTAMLALLGIIVSARAVVWGVQELTIAFGFNDTSSITLSVVAIGTSLPELFVTLSAFKANKPMLAFGNIIGSNIFNILLVLSVPAMLTGVMIPTHIVLTSIIFILISTLLLTFILWNKKLPRYHGIIYLLLYASYLAFVFF